MNHFEPFEVDGIWYTRALASHHVRPMIQLIDDDDVTAAVMYFSDPTPDDLLDEWVEYGYRRLLNPRITPRRQASF